MTIAFCIATFARLVSTGGARTRARGSMRTGRRRLAHLPALVLLLLVAGQSPALHAQPVSGETREDARLFREVMSPFCPGLTLADCPSPAAFELRQTLAGRLARGESRDSLANELVAQYGPQILADPSDTPIGRVVWGVPIAGSLLGAAGLALMLRRWKRARPHEAMAGSSPVSGDLTVRIDEELAALD
ncbi:MAG: hypothetical protein FJW29_01905 [Acidobacteria bacterium]|nr:hypothetical protein [Acidobacteriota bacterium]